MKCDKCNSELTLEQQVKMLQKEVEELQKELQNRPVRIVPCYLDNRIYPLDPVLSVDEYKVKINKSFEELKKLYEKKVEIVQNNEPQIDTKEIQILNLRPNDILVLKTPGFLSKQALDNVKKYLKDVLVESGYDNEILIIFTADELQIIRKDD
jgi:hypothetical protein